jgi:hypothetical protein
MVVSTRTKLWNILTYFGLYTCVFTLDYFYFLWTLFELDVDNEGPDSGRRHDFVSEPVCIILLLRIEHIVFYYSEIGGVLALYFLLRLPHASRALAVVWQKSIP